jgi:hypothetical protein
MHHPGDTWTVLAACVLFLWMVGGDLYFTRRMLAPVYHGRAVIERQQRMAQSTPHPLGKKLHHAKALHYMHTTYQQLHAAQQWSKRVHTPVTIALSVACLGLTAWRVAT